MSRNMDGAKKLEDFGQIKILVIDDDDLTRESIVAYLEDSEFQVFEANNGAVGIEVFQEVKPSLVISDLKMPAMDGISVLEQLQVLDSEVSVIVISGAGDMQDVMRALRSGAFDYLIKPIRDLVVLEHSVNSGLERTRLFRENRRYREALELTNRELAANLRVLKLDQKAARQIQLGYFPKPHQILSHICFNYEVKPSLYLSGDFVNYFTIDESHLGFYIADVAGHGASSALVTLMLKNFTDRLRRRLVNGMDEVILHPDLTLSAINTELISLEIGKHLAIVYGVINIETRLFTYSIGAHFPPPILIQDGSRIFLEGRGLPVGVFEKAEYNQYKIILSVGFKLCLCTDGILEVMSKVSLEKKQQILLEKIGDGFHTLSSLLAEVGSSMLHEVPDDIALLVVSEVN